MKKAKKIQKKRKNSEIRGKKAEIRTNTTVDYWTWSH